MLPAYRLALVIVLRTFQAWIRTVYSVTKMLSAQQNILSVRPGKSRRYVKHSEILVREHAAGKSRSAV